MRQERVHTPSDLLDIRDQQVLRHQLDLHVLYGRRNRVVLGTQ